MTVEDQFIAIRDPVFFTSMKAQIKRVLGALSTNSVDVEGKLSMEVSGVPLSAQESGTADYIVYAGNDGQGSPLYEWKFPTAWLTA